MTVATDDNLVLNTKTGLIHRVHPANPGRTRCNRNFDPASPDWRKSPASWLTTLHDRCGNCDRML